MSDESASEHQPAEPDTAEPESPLRRTLDLFVFAPLGMAMTAMEDLPGLVTKGRNLVENEISNARVVGKFVVDRGVREITQRVTGRISVDDDVAAPDLGSDDVPLGEPETVPSGDSASASAPPRPAPDPADGVVVEQALADYDTLSASQVVRRLESLGPDELRAVHRHEASHRNRRTILNRTSQLLGDGGSAPLTAAE